MAWIEQQNLRFRGEYSVGGRTKLSSASARTTVEPTSVLHLLTAERSGVVPDLNSVRPHVCADPVRDRDGSKFDDG